ncbi:TPA: EpsG family protein [Photobacterium damselae]
MYYIYFLMNIFFSLMDFSDKKHIKKISLLFIVFFGILFIGFRFQNGLDWAFYSSYYEHTYDGLLYIEPVYGFISNIFSYSGISYNIFIFFVTASYFCLLANLFKTYSIYPTCCFVLMSMMMFYFNVEAMRQIIALCFILLGFLYLDRKKIYVYFSFCILASLCHGSAIIFIVVPLLNKTNLYKCNPSLIVICFILSLLKLEFINYIADIIAMFDSGVSSKLIYYVEEAIKNNPPFITFNLIYKILIYLLISSSINEILNDKKKRLYLTIFSFYICVSIIFSGLGTISERINGYFIPFFIVTIFFYIESIDSIRKRLFVCSLLILYSSLSLYKATNNAYFKSQYMPYRNYIKEFYEPNKFLDYQRKDEVKFYFESKK